MQTEPDWVSAVYEAPDDDARRLLCADWFDEYGDPARAELIRLQCRQSSGLPFTDADDDRVYAILEKHRQAWCSHLPPGPIGYWRFHRGFPEELEISVQFLLQDWEIWSRIPTLRYLNVYYCTVEEARELAARPWPSSWIVLRVDTPRPYRPDNENIDPAEVLAEIVRSPRVLQLRELHFLGSGSIAPAIRESPKLYHLKRLGVDFRDWRDPDLVMRFGNRLVVGSVGGAG